MRCSGTCINEVTSYYIHCDLQRGAELTMVAFPKPERYPQRQKRCKAASKPLLLLLIAMLLSHTSSVSASEGARVVLRPYASVADQAISDALSGVASTSQAVAQRVDYRDRYNAFDLSLLGAATGMCSPADGSSACTFRQANPCQAGDLYGANTTLCQLPSFLGGSIPNSELCGLGATVDITLASSDDNSPGNTTLIVATLTAFRTRNSSLTLTITARSGWLIVPFTATTAMATNSARPSTSDDGMDMQQTRPASVHVSPIPTPSPPTILPSWVLMEGDVSYGEVNAYLTAPARQQPMQQDREGKWVGQSPPLERYSCYSVQLPLTGLTSACQALGLELKLRLALVQVKVMAAAQDGSGEQSPGAPAGVAQDQGPDGSHVEASCELGTSVWRAETSLVLQPPWVQSGVQNTTAAVPTETTQQQTAARQQVFSDGVVAATAYSVTLDPRSSENTPWLAALAQQSPLLAATPTRHSLSFLLGTLRPELTEQLPSWTAAGSSTLPLLPASVYLSTCDAASLSVVRDAVLAVLASQGVTQTRVASLVCLEPPYSEVAASQLPGCARDTAMLYNMTLEVPLDLVATSRTSSLSTSSTTGSSSSSVSINYSGNNPSPQQLADVLVGAHFAAPRTCLSTERQMQMSTRLRLELQLPRAAEVEVLDMTDGLLRTGGGLSPLPAPLGGPDSSTTRPTASPADSGGDASSISGGHETTSSSGLRMTELLAVCVVAALLVFFVAAAFIVFRAVRMSRAAAAEAAAVTATAAIFTRGDGTMMADSPTGVMATIETGGATGAVPHSKEDAMPQVQQKASLQVEMSYDSSIEDAASIMLAPEHISPQVQLCAEHKATATTVSPGRAPCEYLGGSMSGGEIALSVDNTHLMYTVDVSQGKLATSISYPPQSSESHLQEVIAQQQSALSSGELISRQRNGARTPTASASIGLWPNQDCDGIQPLPSCNLDTAASLQLHAPTPPNDGTGPSALGPRPPILAPPALLSCGGGDSAGDGPGVGPTHGSVAASGPLVHRPGRALRPVSITVEDTMMQGSGSSAQDLSGRPDEGALRQQIAIGNSSGGGDGHVIADVDDVKNRFSSARSLSVASGTTARPGLTVLSRLKTAAASGAPRGTWWSNALYEPQSALHQQRARK